MPARRAAMSCRSLMPWNGPTLSSVFFVMGAVPSARWSGLRIYAITSHAAMRWGVIRARNIKETDHDEDQHTSHRACRDACGVGAGNAELRATQRRNEQRPRVVDSRLQRPGREVQAIRLGRLRDRQIPRLHGPTPPGRITPRRPPPLAPLVPSPLVGEGTMVTKRVVMGEGAVAETNSRKPPPHPSFCA